MSAKKQYQELVNRLVMSHRPDVRVGKMYGMSIMSSHGRAFVGFSNDDLVVRLDGLEHERAMKLKGAKPYALSNGQPLPGWVRIPAEHVSHWRGFADEARLAANDSEHPAE